MTLLLVTLPLYAQVGWKFEYISNAQSRWKHLGSGDTTVIARLTFSQTDANKYYLTQFTVRPVTNHPSSWFVAKLLLWKDNGNNRFDIQDTLISDNLRPSTIPVQATPVYALPSVPVNTLLQSNRYLFITAVMIDWHDTNPDNLEVDESPSGPDGYWFSVVDSLKDIQITPVPANTSINPYTKQYFTMVAKNLPFTIHNPQPSAAEAESLKLNMFYPRWEALSGSPSSREQSLYQQEFTADVFLPVTGNKSFNLEAVEFDLGYDNNILLLKEVTPSSLWGSPTDFFIEDTLYLTESPAATNFTFWHYRANLKNASADTTTYRLVERDTTLLRLRFKVLKPGVSPLFLQDCLAYDHCGIRYHIYQSRQNGAPPASGYTTAKADAWAKFVLGDYTYPYTKSLLADNPYCGDGRVTWEDLTLFANHIWLNPAAPTWYRRFDIGAPGVHDPDESVSDDTTNFYDLLQLVRNYYRTLDGTFTQKSNPKSNSPVAIVRNLSTNRDQGFECSFRISSPRPLRAIYWRLHFDPDRYQLNTIHIAPTDSRRMLWCYPQSLLDRGIIDLNCIFLSDGVWDSTTVLTLNFKGIPADTEVLITDKIELYDDRFHFLTWQMENSEFQPPIPTHFTTLNTFPNPFNSRVHIAYTLGGDKPSNLLLVICDLQGQIVKVLYNGRQEAGTYSVTWDGCNKSGVPVSSGLYFVALTTPEIQLSRKLLLLR